jgi:hypothetical protein
MPYKTVKDDIVIASTALIQITHGGTLICSDQEDRVDLILAAGSWDSVFWEEGEENGI